MAADGGGKTAGRTKNAKFLRRVQAAYYNWKVKLNFYGEAITVNFKTHWKQFAAAVAAAATLAAPLAAEAHWLSSRQEKEIGNQAVNDFMKEYRTERSWLLDHIQKRIMQFNSDKLWMYGTPGKTRGLEHVLLAKIDRANAISYGGGQIFINEGYLDQLANKEAAHFYYDKREQNPWKKCHIYQMSALAAVMGHEIGHWENEDMLRQYDRQMDTRLLASLIPVGNVWTLLGVAAGTNLINAFNSRDMGFTTEQEADEKAMEYAMYVPEYSVGGEAIVEYRAYQYKLTQGIEDEVKNWLHPHSKTAKRLERALHYQEKLSHGFIKWNGFKPFIDGRLNCGSEFLYSPAKANFDAVERGFYVLGQLATAIHFDICKTRNLKAMREDEVFTDGSPNNAVLLLVGHGNDRREHTKILDTYYNVSMQEAKKWAEAPWDTLDAKYEELIKQESEMANLAYIRGLVELYDEKRMQYKNRVIEDEE